MHLFAGAGGGLLADLILRHQPVIAVEWDRHACAVLRERAAEGWFPGLQVYEGDIRLFDPSEYAGRVDCIHAGFPCQDISVAGKGEGINGERSGLFTEVLRIARAVRPRYLFLENVAAITSRGLDRVLGALTDLGYDAQWITLPASAVGAPHLRARWWCLATHTDGQRVRNPEGAKSGSVCKAESVNDSSQENGSDPKHERRDSRTGHETSGQQQTEQSSDNGGGTMVDTHSPGREEQHAPDLAARSGHNTGCATAERGESWWSAEPDVGRVVNGLASRVDRIKALGNGQVPLQAAVAWMILRGNHAS